MYKANLLYKQYLLFSQDSRQLCIDGYQPVQGVGQMRSCEYGMGTPFIITPYHMVLHKQEVLL
jgi:hypothetical protein